MDILLSSTTGYYWLLCHEKNGLHAKIWTFSCAPTNAKTNFSVKSNFFMGKQSQMEL